MSLSLPLKQYASFPAVVKLLVLIEVTFSCSSVSIIGKVYFTIALFIKFLRLSLNIPLQNQ